MKIDRLAMPPFNTTLMGVLKGVLDYYGIEMSSATVFGASGHAFLINIHRELCPSGPYCWNHSVFYRLIRNLGVQMTDLGFYGPESSREDRRDIEQRLRDALDKGIPCSLLNLENQMITGYDDEVFSTVQPWAPKVDFPPATLSFGTWEELGEAFHVTFFSFGEVERADHTSMILDSLDYAIDLYRNPSKYSWEIYGIGPDAYANWEAAVVDHGSEHGQWWNATVWAECRQMASEYFAEIAEAYPDAAEPATELAKVYEDIADILGRLRDKEMGAGEKIKLIEEAASKETAAIEAVAALRGSIRPSET